MIALLRGHFEIAFPKFLSRRESRGVASRFRRGANECDAEGPSVARVAKYTK